MGKKRKDALHFIGIGGDGMSGLAKVYHKMGFSVTGSNIAKNRRTRELQVLGIPIAIRHAAANLPRAATVVLSSAIPPDNPELNVARRRGLPIVHRLELLNHLMSDFRAIGVAGTHGKTTTAAMIATLLMRAGLDPTFVMGAPSPTLGTHARYGRGRYLVAEICESDGYFLQLHPHIAVITNIGRDHLRTYGSELGLLESFRQFAEQSEDCVACADDAGARRAIINQRPDTLTYRIEKPADLVAYNLHFEQERTHFEMAWRGRPVGTVALTVPGQHNVYNALAALSVGHRLGLSFSQMVQSLCGFQLPERRFEVLLSRPITLIDDYAHLPEQIRANLQTIRQSWRPRRVIAIFQPHRYTRLSYLAEEFSLSFAHADIVVLTDVYAAFEHAISGVNSEFLLEAVRRHHPRVIYLPRQAALADLVAEICEPGDFVIGFNAGDLSAELHRVAQRFQSEPVGAKHF